MKAFTKRQLFITGGFILAIVLISTLFHYAPHIEEAISQQRAADFGFKISPWRIAFEPVLGLLLYFNRSLYSLTEIQFVLYWSLILIVVYTIVRMITAKGRIQVKSFLLKQLANIPIIIGLWFVFLVLLIFIPLPNDTIVNHSENSILVTTHSHTLYSHDGLMSHENQWKWHKRNGFDAFFITDHNNHDQTFDFVQSQRNGRFPEHPLAMCGEEFSGSNHLSLLGLKSKFRTKGLTDSAVIALTRKEDGAVLVNHWFDGQHKTLEYYRDLGVDGFEIENTATDRYYDRNLYARIKVFCTSNHLLMNGGLDFHGYGNVCSVWNAFDIPGWRKMGPENKEKAILEIIRNRNQSRVRVLMYKDRPYYPREHLFFSPFETLFNYFRTLNFLQVCSWIFWILVTVVLTNLCRQRNTTGMKLDSQSIFSILGVMGAVFILGLGMYYYANIEHSEFFTEMPEEYSSLFFKVGGAFLMVSGSIAFFRIRKQIKQRS